ncbi:hypothetical protein KL918_001743 [Ogataea parapolymorpha]|nr:hypothetical protein KL918_001743 [Ogataea parapolymorpha]KAG7874295.1 hypothetical protein KL916_001635 [Ogataea parapolymorpha]
MATRMKDFKGRCDRYNSDNKTGDEKCRSNKFTNSQRRIFGLERAVGAQNVWRSISEGQQSQPRYILRDMEIIGDNGKVRTEKLASSKSQKHKQIKQYSEDDRKNDPGSYGC